MECETLFDVALATLVRNPRQVTLESLVLVPEFVATLLFEAFYSTGRLTPRLVETFLALEYDDLTSLVRERNIRLVGGRPWTGPPLNVNDAGFKKRQY